MLLRATLLLIASVLTAADFSGERALEAVKTAVAFGPRPAGSAASRRMQAWISRELKAQGWEVVEDHFTARTPQGAVAMTNLIADVPGLKVGAAHDLGLASGVSVVVFDAPARADKTDA